MNTRFLSTRSLIVGAVVAVGLMTGSWFAEAQRSGLEKTTAGKAQTCKKDADCTLVPDGCCSCHEGGTQRAIPKKQQEAYEKERQKRCAGTMCAEVMSPHPSCSQPAVCHAGICALGNHVQ
jgi:hypothetical protein